MAFVALEIRQNTNAIQSATIQDVARWSYDSTISLVENPELAAAIQIQCASELNDSQKHLLRAWYAALMRLQLNRFHQAKLGILDEEMAMALGGRGGAYRHSFLAQIWPALKVDFDENFQRYIEENVLPLARDPC